MVIHLQGRILNLERTQSGLVHECPWIFVRNKWKELTPQMKLTSCEYASLRKVEVEGADAADDVDFLGISHQVIISQPIQSNTVHDSITGQNNQSHTIHLISIITEI